MECTTTSNIILNILSSTSNLDLLGWEARAWLTHLADLRDSYFGDKGQKPELTGGLVLMNCCMNYSQITSI